MAAVPTRSSRAATDAGADGGVEALLLAEMRRHDDPYRFWNQPDDGLPLPVIKVKPDRKKPKRQRKPKQKP